MINTVTGPIAPGDLGTTLIHEHIICSSSEFQYAFPGWLPEEKVIDIAVAKLRFAAEKYQVRPVVDGTPLSLGRDIGLLRKVSERSGVQIVASSGFYFYPCFTAYSVPPETMARFLTAEIRQQENGIGILKCAVDSEGVTAPVRRYLETVAIVHRETGLPVYMHSHSGNRTGIEAGKILADNGVASENTVIGHVADCNDPEYALQLLQQGYYVSVDRIGKSNVMNRAETLFQLISAGFAGHIMVSCDHICCRDSVMNETPGDHSDIDALGVIHSMLWPALIDKGVAPETQHTAMTANPAKFL